MELTSTYRSFFTKEAKIEFKIDTSIGLSEQSCIEVSTKASRLPKDQIVLLDGIDIRDSLTELEKAAILNLIQHITKNDADYCLKNRLVGLSKHIVNDYILVSPDVLTQRGWEVDEPKLVSQIINTLINATHVEKAQINFKSNGQSKTPITYTVVGNDNGTIRRLGIMFQRTITSHGEENKVIVASTVLHTK